MSIEALLASLVISSVLASAFFGVTRVLDAMNGSGISGHTPVGLAVRVRRSSAQHQPGER